MQPEILSAFENLIQKSSLEKELQDRLLKGIQKLSLQEQIFLLQLFEKFPEKIPAFWHVSKKKFDYMKEGIGDLDAILEEEIQLFS